MSKATIRVRYDGPALESHEMDISDLAPALLGLSELCKSANRKFNGDRSTVKVLVRADVPQNCFEFDLSLVQTLVQYAQALIEDERAKSAKELLEWLGIGGAAIGAPVGLFKFYAWLNGRSPTDEVFSIEEGKDIVQIQVKGDNNHVVVVSQEVYDLAQDPSVARNARRVVEPLTRAGYTDLEFRSDGVVCERVTKDEAVQIAKADVQRDRGGDRPREAPQTVTAWIKVYSPVYDEKAPMWRFQYGDAHPYMNISETDIAARALERGGALKDDLYRVRLDIQQVVDARGNDQIRYTVKSVLEFHPARIFVQTDWVDEIPPAE